jgi:integral membrane protein (TIGR01906 family)
MTDGKNNAPGQRPMLSWMVTVLVPLVLVLAAVRVVLTPWFLEIEYRTPGFPEDPHNFYLPPHLESFSMEDRLQYANIARLYLLNDADISYLGDLRFPEGQETPPASCQYMDDCSRLYNDRELHHMVDVKNVTQAALNVWYVSIAGLLVLGIFAFKNDWLPEYRRGLARGGWLTLLLIAAILGLVVVAFGYFFVFFHDVFFDPGTWMFLSSDTLIRLFPERFWRDTFLVVGLLSAGLSLLVIWLAPRVRRENQP